MHCINIPNSILCAITCVFLSSANANGEEKPSGKVATNAVSPLSSEHQKAFIEQNCLDCHQGPDAEAGLDLESLDSDFESSDSEAFEKWVRVYDRVSNAEMPPADYSDPLPKDDVDRFSTPIANFLNEIQLKEQRERGRVRARRLTNLQLERTLQDLLGIDIPLTREMAEEPKSEHYSTLARAQSISHFHMQQHIRIVDLALEEAFRRALTEPDERTWEMSAKKISRTRRRTREPEHIDGTAVTWASTLAFYGRLPATTARTSGWYRFEFDVSSLKQPNDHGVFCSIRSGQCVSSAPLMTWIDYFEATPTTKTIVIETWLPKDHMLEVRPADTTLKKARFQGGQSGTGVGGKQNVPGLAIHWLKMHRIHMGAEDSEIRNFLLGDLGFERAERAEEFWNARIHASEPEVQARELILAFSQRAFRRPTPATQLKDYFEVFDSAYSVNENFLESLRAAYRAVLCSARFLYFQEQPGKLDDFSIASRLSYALWNSMPDERLFKLADKDKLSKPNTIRQQVDRMLTTTRGKEFLRDFANEWLELSEIDFTIPDRKIHPDFDSIVQNSMLDETHQFLQDLLENDRSVRNFVKSKHSFTNNRLARFYELDSVAGGELKRIDFSGGEHRGGLLGQGAILKVTANGTNTSPVLRGVWVSRRILGENIPDPPSNVPAIEPDIRGATTIREQLEKHRSMTECSSCHAKIDAPGFALENFDAAGKWREYYPRMAGRSKKRGAQVDASYVTASGEAFDGFDTFCDLAAKNPKPLAKNLVSQLVEYGTGAEISFADREQVEAIVRRSKQSDYGVRTILKEVVSSPIFLTK